MAEHSTRPQFLSGNGRQLLLELVIVFLGVYAAFWVEDYREAAAEKELSREIALALQQGLDNVSSAAAKFRDRSRDGLEAWREARQRGERPPPFFFRIEGAERPPTTLYEAVIQSRPTEVFDAQLVFDLGFFYNEAEGVAERFIRYAEFTESRVLPNLKRDASVFYDESGTLLPEYAAHMDRLEEFIAYWSADAERAEALKLRLEEYLAE